MSVSGDRNLIAGADQRGRGVGGELRDQCAGRGGDQRQSGSSCAADALRITILFGSCGDGERVARGKVEFGVRPCGVCWDVEFIVGGGAWPFGGKILLQFLGKVLRRGQGREG